MTRPIGPIARAAEHYLRAGLSVIALEGKLPNRTVHPHGLREPLIGVPDPHNHEGPLLWSDCSGCRDVSMLNDVFTHPRTTGVGILVQPPYVVVDIDGEEGAQELLTFGVVPDDLVGTAVARTSRGLHIWFGVIGEAQRTTKLGTKLDLKGEGGYVAAPPSLHPSGFTYEWLVELAPSGVLRPPLELPEVLQVVLANQRALTEQVGALRPANAAASLDALVRHVRHLEEGNRNNGLHWAASAAVEDGFSFEEAAPRLLDAAVLAGLDPSEAMTAIRSAYRRARA